MTRAVGNPNRLPIDPSLVVQAVGPIPGVVGQAGTRNHQQQSEFALMLLRSVTNTNVVQEPGSRRHKPGWLINRREAALVLVLT
jgi:hypothetical protein